MRSRCLSEDLLVRRRVRSRCLNEESSIEKLRLLKRRSLGYGFVPLASLRVGRSRADRRMLFDLTAVRESFLEVRFGMVSADKEK